MADPHKTELGKRINYRACRPLRAGCRGKAERWLLAGWSVQAKQIRPGSAGVVCYTGGGRPSINSFGASGRLLQRGSRSLPCTAAKAAWPSWLLPSRLPRLPYTACAPSGKGTPSSSSLANAEAKSAKNCGRHGGCPKVRGNNQWRCSEVNRCMNSHEKARPRTAKPTVHAPSTRLSATRPARPPSLPPKTACPPSPSLHSPCSPPCPRSWRTPACRA